MKKYVIGCVVIAVVAVAALSAVGNHGKATAPKVSSQGSYVALGDSVAAGVGLKYDSDSSACNRTNQAYPDLVANRLNYTLRNIACSGATLPEGILGKQDVNDLLVQAQLQQLFDQSKPKLITLTIGANDAKWTDILRKCYTSECGSVDDTAAVQASLETVTTNLRSMLNQIGQHYAGSLPLVIVTGYHQVFPATVSATCTDLNGINASELAWGRQLQTSINNSLEAAVKGSTATFVPMNFSGHELCTTDPWVQGLGDNQPYHPTAVGQAAFATQIISAIRAGK